jgi:hypothetical protein
VAVDYVEGPFIRDHTPKPIKLRIYNTYRLQATMNLRWYTPDGWEVLPAPIGSIFSLPMVLGENPRELEFKVQVERLTQNINRAAIELTVDGRPTVMLVPVVLHNGNLTPA